LARLTSEFIGPRLDDRDAFMPPAAPFSVCGSSRQHIPSITADLLGQTVSFIWPTAAKYTAYNVITSITQPQPLVCSRVYNILSLAECLLTLFGASR